MWLWIIVGLSAFLALSLLVALTVAAVLGSIGRQITELHSEPNEPEGAVVARDQTAAPRVRARATAIIGRYVIRT